MKRRKSTKGRKPVKRRKSVKRRKIVRRYKPPKFIPLAYLFGPIHEDIRSAFRDFIMSVNRLRLRQKRMTYLMVRIESTRYRAEEREHDVIIPIRLGLMTRVQIEALDEAEVEERIALYFIKGRITEWLGIYVRRKT